tara:strand:+ start:524 stop:805 length:282 start_codon:yes stop_codon:yes gene_type:complete
MKGGKNMKAKNLCNGDLIQIGEEIFFANNVNDFGTYIQIERIDDDGRHPYRIDPDEEVIVHLAFKQTHRYHGTAEPEKWYWASDAVKALLVQN